jgi:hypothetical protein
MCLVMWHQRPLLKNCWSLISVWTCLLHTRNISFSKHDALRLHYILYPTFNIRSTSFFPPWEPRRAETEYSFYALGVQLLRKRVVRNKLYRMRRKWMRRVLRMICSLYAKDKSKQILMTNSSLVNIMEA